VGHRFLAGTPPPLQLLTVLVISHDLAYRVPGFTQFLVKTLSLRFNVLQSFMANRILLLASIREDHSPVETVDRRQVDIVPVLFPQFPGIELMQPS
jgi:hypothetical protein